MPEMTLFYKDQKKNLYLLDWLMKNKRIFILLELIIRFVSQIS